MSLEGKVCVITGATSGIGEVAAIDLARQGARLVLIARDSARGEATLTRLRAAGPGAAHRIHYADLARVAEMKRVAAEIAAAEPRIDLLVNNAGALFTRRQVSPDGLEMHFAVNHVAYFVVTQMLRDRLVAAAPARVVSTASAAHYGAKLDLDDLQFARGYGGMQAYQRSKLFNVMWTRELARRLAGTGVTANCFHPGFVATRYGDNAGGLLSYGVRAAKMLFAISSEKGARTLVYLATSPEVTGVTGRYFTRCREKTPSAAAQDDAAARRLWDETARLVGMT
ncbi:MAG TPA: SDR family NAD(P)-dependent oxidoreductase [Xanthobacteraceae bacterium]|nr:SDR family NAD(P)-dependent oxidoreductase [Xanthobacteraceae bacterium]